MKAYRTKEDAFLLVVFIDGLTGIVFLVDHWKVGIRDFQQFKGGLNGLKRSIGANDLQFHETTTEEAYRLIKRGYDISLKLGQKLPSKVIRWIEDHNIDQIELDGTIYLCFNCEEGNLAEDEINKILRIATDELEKGLIGTDKEEQYFFICESCKGDMHKAHEGLDN